MPKAIGSLMSGNAACNTTEPSSKKAPPWTTDWRCTTTRTSSNATPKRWCASITSRPLFIMVAESMVILGPSLDEPCLFEREEWASRRRQQYFPDLLTPSPLQTLEDRRVLRVYRYYAVTCREVHNPLASCDERFFVG